MEFAFRSRQAMEVANDVETGRLRRFSDLPPPPYGDANANASPVNAALARRREELMWELTKVRNHQDMILREVIETEHAMGFTAAGYNHVPTPPIVTGLLALQDAASESFGGGTSPIIAEHPPSVSRGPAAMRVPPVYPQVEWPPSPLMQPLPPASDTEKQQGCGSSGARMHPLDGCVQLCRSPKKSAVAEEASVPAATNDGTRSMLRDAAGGEQKDGVKDFHGVQSLYENENQSSGQRKTAEITIMNQINGPMMSSDRYRMGGPESVAFHQQNEREFSKPTLEQPPLGDGPEQKQEFRSSGLGALVFSSGYAELRLSPSKQAPIRETLVPVAAKAGEVASGHQRAFCGEPKADVEDGHHKSSGKEMKAVEYAMEDPTNEPTRLPGQQRLAGLENAANNEQKKVGFSEYVQESTSAGAGVKRKLNAAPTASPSKKQNPLTDAAPVQKTTTATNTKSLSINGKESVAGSRGSKKGGKAHLKSIARRKGADTGKRADWSAFYCELCNVQCNSEKMLADHQGGKKHRERLMEVGSA